MDTNAYTGSQLQWTEEFTVAKTMAGSLNLLVVWKSDREAEHGSGYYVSVEGAKTRRYKKPFASQDAAKAAAVQLAINVARDVLEALR